MTFQGKFSIFRAHAAAIIINLDELSSGLLDADAYRGSPCIQTVLDEFLDD